MRKFSRFLPPIAGLAIILLLIGQIDPRQVLSHIKNASPGWLLVGCGWYVMTNLLRAFRFGVLLKVTALRPILKLVPEMFALSFLNNVLPSRTGELSFPYMLLRRHGIVVAESATALLLARIFDYLAVILLFVIFASLELDSLAESAGKIITLLIGISAISVILLLLSPWISTRILRLAKWVLDRLQLADNRLAAIILNFGTDVVAALWQMKSGRIYLHTFLWSLGIWLCTFAWFSAFLSAIGLPVRYTFVVVGSTFASLAKAIPFITIGGFGAHEAGWTMGYMLTGMERSEAITSGFTVNILTLAMSICIGGLVLLWMSTVPSEK